MKGSRFFRYTVYVLIVIFVISRMRVSFREYMDVGYSPVSTYATIALLVLFLVSSIMWIPVAFKTKLSKRVLVFFFVCMTSTVLYRNVTMGFGKQIMFIAFWEAIYFLFLFLVYYREQAFNESGWLFSFLLIPTAVLFISSCFYRNALALAITRIGNNMVFYVITLLPWLLILKNRTFRIFGFLFILAMGLLSLKRSALIILLLSAIPFLYYEFVKTSKKQLRTLIIGIITITAGFFVFSYFSSINNNLVIERMKDIENDEGSGRLERYEDVIRLLQYETNINKVLFGHGYRMVEVDLRSEHGSAHNDFLEVLYDYGYIGLLVFVLIHLALIKRILYLKKTKSSYIESYIVSYIIFLVLNMVSHLVIYPTYFIFLSAYWGTIEGAILSKRVSS